MVLLLFQIDNLFEAAIESENITIGEKILAPDIGYYGTEVVAVYALSPTGRRRRRQTYTMTPPRRRRSAPVSLVVEVEIAAKDSALNATEVDAVYDLEADTIAAVFDVLKVQSSAKTLCR